MFLILSSCETGIIQLNKNIWSSYYVAGTLPGTRNTESSAVIPLPGAFTAAGKETRVTKEEHATCCWSTEEAMKPAWFPKESFLEQCFSGAHAHMSLREWFAYYPDSEGPGSNMLLGDADAAGLRTTLWAAKGSKDPTRKQTNAGEAHSGSGGMNTGRGRPQQPLIS